MDYSLSFPAFIGIVGMVGWFLVQRQITKNDKEATADKLGIDEKFKEHGSRLGALSERIQGIDVAMSNKVSREELDKALDRMADKIDSIKLEVKEDLRELKSELISAINHRPN